VRDVHSYTYALHQCSISESDKVSFDSTGYELRFGDVPDAKLQMNKRAATPTSIITDFATALFQLLGHVLEKEHLCYWRLSR
jgi:hypothetical protein